MFFNKLSTMFRRSCRKNQSENERVPILDQYGYVDAVVRATRERLGFAATVFEGRKRTWGDVLDGAARLAGGFKSLGLSAGDRIAILAHNSDVYLELYLAAPWCGAVIAHLNWRWSLAENSQAIADSEPSVLVVDDSLESSALADLAKAFPSLKIVSLGARSEPNLIPISELRASTPIPNEGRKGRNLLAIYYTGGTTGRSKGVMLSHDGVVRNSMATRAAGVMPDGTRLLVIAPLFHLGAGAGITGAMLAGGTIIIDKAFDPERTLQLIETTGITDAFLVPTMITMLLEHPGFSTQRIASLRRVIYGSSPISADTLDRILNLAPHVDFYQAYGLTEVCCTATVLRPEFHVGAHRAAGHHRSAGQAISGVQLKIVGRDGAAVERGAVGEIWIGGDTLMLGYWNQPDATAAVMQDGWFRSGDGGYIDEHGLLYVVDRLKDMIVSGGENVYSAEVENAISLHPAVAQVAVIGVPDERWGERVHAVIVARAHVTEAEIIDHCRSLIGRFKCPRSVEFWTTPLPMSAAGKILKHELRAKHWLGHERNVS